MYPHVEAHSVDYRRSSENIDDEDDDYSYHEGDGDDDDDDDEDGDDDDDDDEEDDDGVMVIVILIPTQEARLLARPLKAIDDNHCYDIAIFDRGWLVGCGVTNLGLFW